MLAPALLAVAHGPLSVWPKPSTYLERPNLRDVVRGDKLDRLAVQGRLDSVRWSRFR